MAHRMNITWTALAAALLALPAWAAQDSPTQPAGDAPAATQEVAPAAEGEIVEGIIRAVRGPLTQIRFSPDEPWQQAEVGMRVPVGAELRTGARSQIQFVLPPDQVITIDRMSQITLLQAIQQGPNRVKTDVGMVRGRANYQVANPEVEHDASVRSPNATNAVRGTQEFGISDDPLYGPHVYSINTPAHVTNSKGQTVPLGGEGENSQMSGDTTSEGQHSFFNSILDPSNSRSRTRSEERLVGRFPGLGGLDTNQDTGSFRGDQTRNLIQPPPTTPDIDLNIGLVAMLMWNSSADLDIFLIDPQGYKLSTFQGVGPGYDTTSPNGGYAGPDITSGPAAEYIIYLNPHNHPTGTFEVGAAFFNGPETSFTIEIRKNGELIDSNNGSVGPSDPMKSFYFEVPDLNMGVGLSGGNQGKGKGNRNNGKRRK